MAAILSTSFARAVTDGAATWPLASVTGVQIGHLCVAESEAAQVTKVGPGTTITVRRGVDGTAVTAHAIGTPIAVYRGGEVPTDVSTAGPASAVVTLRQAALTLTHAELLALVTTPRTLIPAQGVNTLIVLTDVLLLGRFGAAYTGTAADDVLSLAYDSLYGITEVANLPNGSVSTLSQFFANLASPPDYAGGRIARLCVPPLQDLGAWGVVLYKPDRLFEDLVNRRLIVSLQVAGTLAGGQGSNTCTISALYGVLDVTTGVWV